MNIALLDVGGGVTVEIRRNNGYYEFRPVRDDDPQSYAAVVANVELRHQGGAWAPVPNDLLNEARRAFETGVPREPEVP